MPLFADTTALRALGSMDSIQLLRHYDPDVVISPWVRRETRRFDAQLAEGESGGWLRVLEPSASEVEGLLRSVSELHRGEVEILVLLGRQLGRPATVLIDEGFAYDYVRRQILPRASTLKLVCLAQVLHHLEGFGHLPSASDAMVALQQNGDYAWAPEVRQQYDAWCREQRIAPLP